MSAKIIFCFAVYGLVKKTYNGPFLKPFVEELTDLHKNGIHVSPSFDQNINIKVHTFLSPVDTIARCALQNMIQFNGEYGCPFCYHPGRQVAVGRGNIRVYCGNRGLERTELSYSEDVYEADNLDGSIIYGIKGSSILSQVPLFSFMKSHPPDYLHCVLLGVVKLFILSWFDSTNNSFEWYLGSKKDAFNERLLKICPPSGISRVPRNINDVKLYKGSEFKNFLLYYSLPCLKNLSQNSKYYKHWALLVYSMHIFLSEKIFDVDLRLAGEALEKFVLQIEELYPETMMKYNVHLLLHLKENVQNFGALWAWSTFPYESYNLIIRQMVFSSQYVMNQICKSYLRLQSIKDNKTFEDVNCSIEGKKLFEKYTNKFRRSESCIYFENLRILTRGKPIELDVIQKAVIQELLQNNISINGESYNRFISNEILFYSSSYSRVYK